MRPNDLPLPPPDAYRTLVVCGVRGGEGHEGADCVAQEAAVAMEYNGISHAVMMATPGDLEDFALGFSITEGIVDRAAQVHDVEVTVGDLGYTLHARIATECFARLKERRRNLTGRTGCGLCGTESLAHAVRRAPPLGEGPVFRAGAVSHAVAQLRGRQLLAAVTGSTHAAMWCDAQGTAHLVREDVGRHNALDKLVGALAQGRVAAHEGFIVVTSRASYEMVQKTAAAGVSLLAAVSGVTALAVDVAQRSGVALAGFVRGGDISVYSHAQRLLLEVPA
jgi:FdhD protein